MRTTLLVAFLLAGCASSPRRELHQAAMPAPSARPPPGAPPARLGMPGERVPGQQPRTLPRSPNKRVVPASEEPGWWKADEVRAGKHGENGWGYAMLLPYLDGLPKEDARALAHKCAAQSVGQLEQVPELMKTMKAGDLDANFAQGPCLDALLYQLCAHKELAGRSDKGGFSVKEALEHVDRLAKAECPEWANTPAVRAIVDVVRRQHLH